MKRVLFIMLCICLPFAAGECFAQRYLPGQKGNVFFSAGLSALAGYETTNWNCKLLYDGATLKNDGCFIYGFAPAFEMEAFLSDRLVFLFNVRQRIFFGSSVGNFHTAVVVGVKYIFN